MAIVLPHGCAHAYDLDAISGFGYGTAGTHDWLILPVTVDPHRGHPGTLGHVCVECRSGESRNFSIAVAVRDVMTCD